MSMTVGGIGGSGGISDYWDMFAGRVSAEDAADMADAVDFDDALNPAQEIQGSLWGFSARRVIPLAGALK